MDSFKAAELKRMELGGNEGWRLFWEEKAGESWGKPGEGGDAAAAKRLEERYGTDIGSEYKERLGCKTEGREYTGLPPTERKKMSTAGTDASTARTASPHFAANASGGIGPKSQKVQNEDFFARKGNENAGRPEGLAPSQGGKYAGFGSAVEPVAVGGKAGAGAAAPGLDDFQADPVAALTKGFGWFTKTVGQGVKTVNDGYIQPTAQKIAESDIAAQARVTAAQAAKNIQTGTKGAAEKFNNFVEGAGEGSGGGGGGSRGGAGRAKQVPERQDFWDSFGDAGKETTAAGKPSSIGTSAMKKGGGGGGGGKEDGWGEW
ncbi:Zn finger-containing GTPase- Activating Protein for ARF [Puttea exsequens]|nr:Zn finger-containing GTPase- Activating Protein for ARF [Puttea exsequens]